MIELEKFSAGNFEKSPNGYRYFVPSKIDCPKNK